MSVPSTWEQFELNDFLKYRANLRMAARADSSLIDAQNELEAVFVDAATSALNVLKEQERSLSSIAPLRTYADHQAPDANAGPRQGAGGPEKNPLLKDASGMPIKTEDISPEFLLNSLYSDSKNDNDLKLSNRLQNTPAFNGFKQKLEAELRMRMAPKPAPKPFNPKPTMGSI